MSADFRYLSVCSGIEAASVAWHPLGWVPAAFSEIEAFPRAVLSHRFPNVPLHGDFTTIEGDEYGPVDLLVGGTPCQDFSVAGLRKGLSGERGNLTLEFLRLAQRLRPRWLVWENVPGVLSQDGGRAFGAILGGMVELGYGFAYRVLDAQFVRVDGLERAVPQRRRRVFVVGYLGDWRRAAAVLFEREGLSRHSAPRRLAGPGSTIGTLGGTSPGGGWRIGPDEAAAGQLIAFGGNNTRGPVNVSTALNAHGGPNGRQDFESETFVVAPPLTSNPYVDHESREGLLVAHTLRGEGFDASEDGTGRGTPLVPICFDATQITSRENRCNPRAGDPCHPLAASAHPPALAYGISADCFDRSGEGANATAGERSGLGIEAELSQTLKAKRPNAVATAWAVRRLTPLEAERLQGFPDGWTDVPYRGKPAADGPRYKALGNSFAVNVVRWIGTRIQAVESLATLAQSPTP